nr:GNAT family N-acetyltransferase [Falsirhodobacter halotolerans]
MSDGIILVRPLTECDRGGVFAAAADPATWAGHPAHDRWQPEVFGPYFDTLCAGKAVAIEKDGAIIGVSRFYVPPDQPEDIAIGFTFLNRAHWGGSVNAAVKQLMLDHAFARVATVWFHIAPTNIRSQKATAKLGAVHRHDAVLDLSGTPTLWQCWSLPRP